MEIHQLRTLVVVAREGSITRASEQLYLSQPAVSAHIKAIEDSLGVPIFARTPRGMEITPAGERLLQRAHEVMAAHQTLMSEASRIRGQLIGQLRLGASGDTNTSRVGELVKSVTEHFPELDVSLRYSTQVQQDIRHGLLDAGFYNETGNREPGFSALEVEDFSIYLVASSGLLEKPEVLDWKALEAFTWVLPDARTCCGRTAEALFEAHGIRPRKIISVDRERHTRALIASGVGIGLLHGESTRLGQQAGELDLLCPATGSAKVLFTWLASRDQDPLVAAAVSLLRSQLLA